MGASNTTDSNKKYYKLKEDKRDASATKGENRFFEQVKIGDRWGDGAEFNSMSGYLQNVSIKEYEYEGAKKEALQVELLDNDDNKTVCVFSLGFNTFTAQGILNALAGEAIWNVLSFNCGKPKGDYPTLWINNDGNKTAWKYSKENGNWDKIPPVTNFTDDEGNKIKKGVKANLEFWRGVLAEIQSRCAKAKGSSANSAMPSNNIKTDTSTNNIGSDVDPLNDGSDLPF